MKTLPVVEVLWRDAEGDMGWEATEETLSVQKCPLVVSVGQLLMKNEHVICLCLSHSETDNTCRMRIPTPWVEKFTELRSAGSEEIDVYA